MNANDLIDLSIGLVDPDRRESLEQRLADDPWVSSALDRLSRNLDFLLDDGLGDLDPPRDLARRTVAVATGRGTKRTVLEFTPVRVPFRWADVAVAAGIFAAGLLTLFPAMQRGKARMAQSSCTFNLHHLGFSLSQYSGLHGTYPYVSSGEPGSRAGMFAVLLHDQEMLEGVTTLDCPGNGVSKLIPPLPPFSKICQDEAKDPNCPNCLHHFDYAYNLGYRHPTGQPGPISSRLQAAIPLLADNPGHANGKILEGNSPNHGGAGQNVLYSDGHVSWHSTRRLNAVDADMYLNEFGHAAPGVSPPDTVLAPANFRFDGQP